MHRTDAEGNVAGQFHPGNPAIGQKATRIGADWLNAIQEEISAVVEGAGDVLDKENNAQLFAAIVSLVAGVVGDGSGAVPTVRQVLAAGLATGGGNLAADRTITVTKATALEVAAQTRDDVAVTPLGLAGLVGLTTVGGAWVLQLGTVKVMVFTATAGANANTVVTLPVAFTTLNRGAWVNGGIADGNENNWVFVTGRGLTTVSVWNARPTNIVVDIIAIGN